MNFLTKEKQQQIGRIPYGLIILLHVEVMIVVFKLISRQMVTPDTEELWLSLLNLNLI